MELYELKGMHVFSGKDVRVVFAIKRRKGQRPIDVILDNFDLGGVHVHSIKKLATKLPPAFVVEANIRVIGRR